MTSSDQAIKQQIFDKIKNWRMIYDRAGDQRVAAIIEGIYDRAEKILHKN